MKGCERQHGDPQSLQGTVIRCCVLWGTSPLSRGSLMCPLCSVCSSPSSACSHTMHCTHSASRPAAPQANTGTALGASHHHPTHRGQVTNCGRGTQHTQQRDKELIPHVPQSGSPKAAPSGNPTGVSNGDPQVSTLMKCHRLLTSSKASMCAQQNLAFVGSVTAGDNQEMATERR